MLKQAGIANYTIWNTGNELFGYYECEKGADYAARIQAESEVVDRWNAYMQDVMVMEMDPVTGAQPKWPAYSAWIDIPLVYQSSKIPFVSQNRAGCRSVGGRPGAVCGKFQFRFSPCLPSWRSMIKKRGRPLTSS